MADIALKHDCRGIDWNAVVRVIREAGLSTYSAECTQRAFEHSYVVVFVLNGSELIGTGRALSDGACQAVIYDIAVLPKWQGRGIGKRIMESILEKTDGQNRLLYASPGKEGFYEKFAFRRMRTGMSLFKNQREMQEKGFSE
ncbi:MAG: GNAT family N-acetyltransferase [Syntrophales bacterium]|jgi:ribosomal protein S18 acetylase RimI-like enzyme|nr:GNAT family N-acetyltransferase [Syntrophales bacterium]MDY0044936.1 GNAT family N-acetyltransferase [Syntrophales bacterium]